MLEFKGTVSVLADAELISTILFLSASSKEYEAV
jgi:hypothetical protein